MFYFCLLGEKIKIATIGGSITAGQGSFDAPNWPQWLKNYMEDNYGAEAAHGMNVYQYELM